MTALVSYAALFQWEIIIVWVFLDLSFDIEHNAEVVRSPIFKEDADPFQRLVRAFPSRVERSGP